MARQAFHKTSGLATCCLFNGSDTALRDGPFLPRETKPQVVSVAKGHFRKDDDRRWQPSGARSTLKATPQGESNANQFLIHKFATLQDLLRTLLHELMTAKPRVN